MGSWKVFESADTIHMTCITKKAQDNKYSTHATQHKADNEYPKYNAVNKPHEYHGTVRAHHKEELGKYCTHEMVKAHILLKPCRCVDRRRYRLIRQVRSHNWKGGALKERGSSKTMVAKAVCYVLWIKRVL